MVLCNPMLCPIHVECLHSGLSLWYSRLGLDFDHFLRISRAVSLLTRHDVFFLVPHSDACRLGACNPMVCPVHLYTGWPALWSRSWPTVRSRRSPRPGSARPRASSTLDSGRCPATQTVSVLVSLLDGCLSRSWMGASVTHSPRVGGVPECWQCPCLAVDAKRPVFPYHDVALLISRVALPLSRHDPSMYSAALAGPRSPTHPSHQPEPPPLLPHLMSPETASLAAWTWRSLCPGALLCRCPPARPRSHFPRFRFTHLHRPTPHPHPAPPQYAVSTCNTRTRLLYRNYKRRFHPKLFPPKQNKM